MNIIEDKVIKEKEKWKILDEVKERFFDILREGTRRANNYIECYRKFKEEFQKIPDDLIKEWKKIVSEYKNNSYVTLSQLKGRLYEALFYFACLDNQRIHLDAEIIIMGGEDNPYSEYPPWIEAIPLYDIIPSLHYLKTKKGWKRRAPQTKADFLVTYIDDRGPLPPALIDVKSRKPTSENKEKWGWEVVAAMRKGFIFQLAWPKVEFPKSLKEWIIRTPCSKCGTLNKGYRKCRKCGEELFPFTIVDAYYERKWLREKLQDVLGELTPRKQKILAMRFGLEDGITHTLEEVGKKFGVTRERIRQIESAALKKIAYTRIKKGKFHLLRE